MRELWSFVLDPRVRRGERVLDLGVIVALAWIFCAVAITVLFGATLGLRGWGWLLVHHLLCVVGCTHELLRGWKRRKLPLDR
jgi:hypothetical protein